MGQLDVNLSGITIDNPIIPASGTFGYGIEYQRFYDINILGAFSCKGTTLNPRYGNPLPRIAECASGMLNAVGLQNPGIDHVIDVELKELATFYHKKIFANVSGFSIDEYVQTAMRFDSCDIVGWIELNISCPNVKHGGLSFGTSPDMAAEVTNAVKSKIHKPLYVKLSPNVSDIATMAKAVENGGADGLVVGNTLTGARFDLATGKPILTNITGGLSGPALFPIALRCVYQCAKAVDIPIIGCGGITTPQDVIEMISAGASAVEVGAANLVDPYACYQLVQSLPQWLDHYNIESIQSLTGRSLHYGNE